MTAAVILISFLISMAVYSWTPWDGYLLGMTFYVLTFLAGLFAATFYALRAGPCEFAGTPSDGRDWRCIRGICVLWLNFIGSHIAWAVGDEHYVLAQVLDTATVAYFVLAGTTRWEWTIGLLFAASVLFGALGMLGLLPEAGSGFITASFASISGILGNIASAILGFGAGDSGGRVRTLLRVRPRLARQWMPLATMLRRR